MPRFATAHRVPFTPGQMYAVVADVERYPEFLPLCEALIVESRSGDVDGGEATLVARMTVGFGAIREQFRSRVSLTPAAPEIRVEHIDGPFEHLVNRWRFHAAPEGSVVDFEIDYAFRSLMLQLMMGALFDQAVRRYTAAFEARAHAVYGGATA